MNRVDALERVAEAALNVVVLPPHNDAYSDADRRRIWTNALSDALDALPVSPVTEGLDVERALQAIENADRKHRLRGADRYAAIAAEYAALSDTPREEPS